MKTFMPNFMENAAYPFYFLENTGELFMNAAAQKAGAPFNDESFMRRFIEEQEKKAGADKDKARSAGMASAVLGAGEFTLLPFENGVACALVVPAQSAGLNFSREIREPLADIFAALPMLAKDKTDREAKLLQNMQEKCYRLLRITSNIESVAMLEKAEFATQVFDLNEMLESICTSAALLCPKDEAMIHYSAQNKFFPIKGSKSLLEAAVLNILRNAWQYGRDGNEINVSLKLVGKQALLQIEDKGHGIRSEIMDKIFDPYFSADPYGGSDEKQGLGLGLCVAKLAAQQHGGTITAQSEYGTGSCFSLALPLHESDELILESEAAPFITSYYSPMYIHLEGYIHLPVL